MYVPSVQIRLSDSEMSGNKPTHSHTFANIIIVARSKQVKITNKHCIACKPIYPFFTVSCWS